MLDQTQITPILLSLSALLEHPDFQAGLADVRKYYFEDHGPVPLTEEDMMDEVEMNLSRRVIEKDRATRLRVFGEQPPSYLQYLAYVVGTINEGLTYAR